MEQLNTWYKTLHADPELSRKEYRTADKLSSWLAEMGLEVHRIGETAVVGILHGAKEGKTVALRADMDALPIREQTGLPYASRNAGVMHACGHDFHMTAVLGAAELLCKRKDHIKGTVQFIFQPDEEDCGYAAILSQHEIMKDTVAVFGAHVDPALPAGVVGIRSGAFYACASVFDITVLGCSTHGATPQKGVDALHAATLAVDRLIALRQEGEQPLMLSVGSLHAGSARNIIADTATLNGIIRCAEPKQREKVAQDIQQILQEISTQTGARFNIVIKDGYRGVFNPHEWASFVEQVARETLGKDNVAIIPAMLMTTEDFGEYLHGREGCFYHVGVGSEEGLHSSRFAPDPKLLSTAAVLHAAVIEKYLEK